MSLKRLLAAMSLLLATPVIAAAPDIANDYPTEARADFVFACMVVNGNDRQTLGRCSCAIDHIASVLPYDDYVAAETVMSIQLASGEAMSIFKTSPWLTEQAARLKRARAEADVICFH